MGLPETFPKSIISRVGVKSRKGLCGSLRVRRNRYVRKRTKWSGTPRHTWLGGNSGVVGDVARRVGDAGQPVGVVIGVCGGLVVLIRHRGAPPARIVGELRRGGVGIGDLGKPAHRVVGKRGLVVQGIGDRRAVAPRIVRVGGHVVLRIRDGAISPAVVYVIVVTWFSGSVIEVSSPSEL